VMKQREFVRLAIVAGCSKRRLQLAQHVPNVIQSPPSCSPRPHVGVGDLLTEASLSFLGVGVCRRPSLQLAGD